MRTAIALILGLVWPTGPAGARACANALYTPVGQERVVSRLDFDQSGRRAVAALGVKLANLQRFVAMQRGLTLVAHPEGGEYGVLFNPDPLTRDKGYVLRGTRVDGTFIVHSFYKSSVSEDLRYFDAVADIHQIAPRRLLLKKAILRCPSLMLKASTQVKLWLKHRLSIEEVTQFLNTARRAPESHRAPVRGKERYVVESRDWRGRILRVVLQDEGLCPNALVTAYEIR